MANDDVQSAIFDYNQKINHALNLPPDNDEVDDPSIHITARATIIPGLFKSPRVTIPIVDNGIEQTYQINRAVICAKSVLEHDICDARDCDPHLFHEHEKDGKQVKIACFKLWAFLREGYCGGGRWDRHTAEESDYDEED